MDNLTVLEAVYLTSVGIASFNLKNSVPNHIPLHNQVLNSDQLQTQNYLDGIQAWTDRKEMTKMMIFNFSKKLQFTSDVKLKGERLDVVDEVKLLGTIITNDLKWNKNTKKLYKMQMLKRKCCIKLQNL